jgi:hypothetical protein
VSGAQFGSFLLKKPALGQTLEKLCQGCRANLLQLFKIDMLGSSGLAIPDGGCQTVCFQTKNPNLGKFWRVLQWKMLVYFMDTFYGLLLYFMGIWCSSWYFGIFFPFWYFAPRKIWQPCT